AGEGAGGKLLQAREVGVDLVFQTGGPCLASLEVEVAALGGDGEARWYVEAGTGHVGEAGALAADEVLEFAAAVGLAVAEEVEEAFLRLRIAHSGCWLYFPVARRIAWVCEPLRY